MAALAGTVGFRNVYGDTRRAEAYARLEFPGTYALAFRDLPDLLRRHVAGRRALDFGCGAGRSTRLLQRLGFSTVGIDIAGEMVALAAQADPEGDYRVVPDGDFSGLAPRSFDLVLSAFAFDNIPDRTHRAQILRGLRDLLADEGRIVILGSRPEIYTHEWASFTTQAFPENRHARGGDTVRIVMTDVPDARPVVDLLWTHEDYLELFGAAGLRLLEHAMPLGRPDEPQRWVSETQVAPWSLYVLSAAG